jgi:ankyrin repeat protein
MQPNFRFLLVSLIACLCWIGCVAKAPTTPLTEAAEKGNIWIVKKHITAKSDLNKKDAAGWTALHLAAMKGELGIVKLLAEAGADVNRKSKDGKTPLEVAREKKQTEVVKYLQEFAQGKPQQPSGQGRGLIDGGLGVGQVLDSQ